MHASSPADRALHPTPMQPPATRQALVLLGFLAVVFLVAALGGWVTAASLRTWYPTLTKPDWTPPNGVFGPVWTVLYVAMATAAWLVWRIGDSRITRFPLAWWALQLSLNLGWSLAFFGLERPGLAVAVIVSLWLAIAGTMQAFWRVSRPAGALMAPYLAWVTFAAALNGAIWQLN